MATTRMDYTDLIKEIVQPSVVDNIVLPSMDKLYGLFTKNTSVQEGKLITDPNCLTETSSGGQFTESDSDPGSLYATFANPYWTKTYFQEAASVSGIQMSQAKGSKLIASLIEDAAMRATRQLFDNHVFSAVMTQIKADVDSSSAYSDGSVTRSTILQSYEENTDTAITTAIFRTMASSLALKKEMNWAGYVALFEQAVWNKFWPLADATITKTQMNPSGSPQNAGYQPVNTFDNIAVAPMYGMTTGDVFLLNRSDVQIQEHMPLEITLKTPKELNSFDYKVIVRIGVNAWVRHPGFQGKLTLKD